ncbi:P1 family peptidase, partial [uncultured Bilophila sp.]|uniref:P1 family peptidase n=2 Tax=uncultured Bilophila sp. TaxID=529385 RepID=UPI002627B384
RPVGKLLCERLAAQWGAGYPAREAAAPEKGSIIMVLATDAPLDIAQLGRLAQRAGNGLARTGSIYGHGSGDVAVAFSTAHALPWPEAGEPVLLPHAPDSCLDVLFQAAAEATEQAVFKALFLAEPIVGREGRRRLSIREALPEWREIVGKEALCAF